MRKLKIFTHCFILATTPTLFAYPQHNPPHSKFQMVNYGYQQEDEEWIRPTTYDEIMQMLKDLESGELERKYSSMQLKKLNDYLATLAREGMLPDEFEEEVGLEEDIHDLIYEEDSAFKLAHYWENSNEYMAVSAVLNSYSDCSIIQCGKISNGWKKTKKFVKKHKKAIVIGAVIVVVVTIVVVAVVTGSSTSTASALAGAAGAAAGAGSESSDSSYSESKKSESKEGAPSVSAVPKETSLPIDPNEAFMMKELLDEQVSSFKEFLIEDNAAQQASSSKKWDEMSFEEKAREMGASIAHKALDEVTDLVKVVPQLCEEVKELGAKFLPETLQLPNGDTQNSIENYENLVAKGHKAIDTVFSTDQIRILVK